MSYRRRGVRLGTLGERRGGRGRSGNSWNKSISSFPCTSRTSFGFRGFGRVVMPGSFGACIGSGILACAIGSPFGVRAIGR